jgi:hypothetical protein
MQENTGKVADRGRKINAATGRLRGDDLEVIRLDRLRGSDL